MCDLGGCWHPLHKSGACVLVARGILLEIQRHFCLSAAEYTSQVVCQGCFSKEAFCVLRLGRGALEVAYACGIHDFPHSCQPRRAHTTLPGWPHAI